MFLQPIGYNRGMQQMHQQLRKAGCEVRFDDLTRLLYATDASIYQIMPEAVAFPRSAADASSLMRAASELGYTLIPRGAGTGLAGGAVGDGLVIDFARYTRQITDLNLEARTVRVGAGVVLDQLNAFLKPHGYWFGPDVATSSRATLGGMIANNSSGAHVPAYGTTDDHLVSIEAVLADGTIAVLGGDSTDLPEHRSKANVIVDRCAAAIEKRFPPGLLKRWPGYGFEPYLRSERRDLARLFSGSEGTLAGMTSAVINIVPLPQRKAIGVLFFDTVEEAMAATVELLDLGASAIEHIDRLLFDQTRGQRTFAKARALMRLDEQPPGAILIVEFFEDIEDRLAALERKNVGTRSLICTDSVEQELVWSVRKHGLSLLTACKGSAKPTPGIEDVCVRPERLPEYVRGLHGILDPLGIEASYYGHAASGELHVRPKVDLHTAEDIAKYRQIADEVSALCLEFKGSIAAEHGVGIARTQYLADHIGPDLMQASRELKELFDPKNRLNPGKIIADGRYSIDTNLRLGAGHEIQLPFEPVFGFIERDGSFVGNLEQCNGCGGCRKDAPTMCPTFIATGEEYLSTRGRANIIRAALERRTSGDDDLFSPELEAALEYCLSCKACKSECPSNVDLALLKAELNHARHQKHGIPLLDRMIANADFLGRLNCGPHAPLVNAVLRARPTRWLMEKTLGFAADRTMPPYTSQRFDRWFKRNGRNGSKSATRGQVILWDDCWTRYNETRIGRAAVKVLEAAGFDVTLADGRKCCGRPAASRGVLDQVRELGNHNIELFRTLGGIEPILFLEPSCYTMFTDEYRQLKFHGADDVAARCILFEQFMFNLLEREPDALPFKSNGRRSVGIHAHCHAKALTDVSFLPKLAGRIPDADARLLDTACCGMAGAYGMLKSKFDLSKKVAEDLVNKINALEPGTTIVASGMSCRHQITDFAHTEPLHMAELLADAL